MNIIYTSLKSTYRRLQLCRYLHLFSLRWLAARPNESTYATYLL